MYGDGNDAECNIYEEKLAQLREAIEPPINKRQREKYDQEQIARDLAAEEEKAKQEVEKPLEAEGPPQ